MDDAAASVTRHLLSKGLVSELEQATSDIEHQTSSQRHAVPKHTFSSSSISDQDGISSAASSRQLAQERPGTPPKPPHRPARPKRPPPASDPLDDPALPAYLRVSSYHASTHDLAPKGTMPNCTKCYGCSTHLMSMAEVTRFSDRNFTNEKGATSGWLFRAYTNKTASGIAVVKAYCLPIAKVRGS